MVLEKWGGQLRSQTFCVWLVKNVWSLSHKFCEPCRDVGTWQSQSKHFAQSVTTQTHKMRNLMRFVADSQEYPSFPFLNAQHLQLFWHWA